LNTETFSPLESSAGWIMLRAIKRRIRAIEDFVPNEIKNGLGWFLRMGGCDFFGSLPH
jgi:hypothetical protein